MRMSPSKLHILVVPALGVLALCQFFLMGRVFSRAGGEAREWLKVGADVSGNRAEAKTALRNGLALAQSGGPERRPVAQGGLERDAGGLAEEGVRLGVLALLKRVRTADAQATSATTLQWELSESR